MASFDGQMSASASFMAPPRQKLVDDADLDEFRFNLMILLLQKYSEEGLKLLELRSVYLHYYMAPKWDLNFANLATSLGVAIPEIAGESEDAKTERILTSIIGVEPLSNYFEVRVDEGGDPGVPGNRRVWMIRGASDREMEAIALLASRGHSMRL